jgi:hypothetical protein
MEIKQKKKKASLSKWAADIDMSRSTLEDLMEQGYNLVTWRTSPGACNKCRKLNNKKWYAKDFILQLLHDAPIYERSHVNCRCELLVTGPKLPPISIDALS